MKKTELGAILIGVVIAIALLGTTLVWAHFLANSQYSNGASNLLGIIGTVPLIAALAIASWTRWHRTCAVPYCLRIGEHPVNGTLKKVCDRHHTAAHHQRVYDLFHAEHVAAGRLEFGESPAGSADG
jgi:hypothetical protein